MEIFLLILLQIFLIFLNAVFACAEIAVLGLNDVTLERKAEEGNRRAKRLFKLTRDPAKFLATIQVAITLSGFLGSAFAAENFSDRLVNWVISLGVSEAARGALDAVAVILITLILSYFTLVFGELVPKRLAMKKSEGIAMGISGAINFISIIFKPIVAFLSLSTNLVLRLIGIDPNAKEDEVDEEEILLMVDAGSEAGAIETHERELIQNVFEFNDTPVSDIITRRGDVIYLKSEDDDEAWLETIKQSRNTLYPICDGDIDNIVGILNTKDYFRMSDHTRENVLENAVVDPYFVPETVTADVLFKNMKATKNSMAIVIDEYGSMIGIVTFSDLIEELVGEINDDITEDEENAMPHLEKQEGDSWLAVGNVLLEDIEAELSVKIESEDFDTVSGLAFDIIGEIPEDGVCDIPVDMGTVTVYIKRVEAHCISLAYIEKKAAPDEESEE